MLGGCSGPYGHRGQGEGTERPLQRWVVGRGSRTKRAPSLCSPGSSLGPLLWPSGTSTRPAPISHPGTVAPNAPPQRHVLSPQRSHHPRATGPVFPPSSTYRSCCAPQAASCQMSVCRSVFEAEEAPGSQLPPSAPPCSHPRTPRCTLPSCHHQGSGASCRRPPREGGRQCHSSAAMGPRPCSWGWTTADIPDHPRSPRSKPSCFLWCLSGLYHVQPLPASCQSSADP